MSKLGEQKHKLLVVDDEKENLDFVGRVFRERFVVLKALSGAEGVETLQRHPDVAVVIADQRMPGMSGSEFLWESYKTAPDAMRILLTGYSDYEAVVDAINRGKVWNYLTKPVTAEQLSQAVESSLEIYLISRRNKALTEEMALNNRQLQLHREGLQAKLDERARQLLEAQRKMQEIARQYALPGLSDRAPLGDASRPLHVEIDIPTRIDVLGEPVVDLFPGTARWERIPFSSEAAGTSFDARIRDLGQNAARIASAQALPLLSRVALTFDLKGFGQTVLLGLTISRCTIPVEVPRPGQPSLLIEPGFGVLFEAISLEEQQAIIALIQTQGTR